MPANALLSWDVYIFLVSFPKLSHSPPSSSLRLVRIESQDLNEVEDIPVSVRTSREVLTLLRMRQDASNTYDSFRAGPCHVMIKSFAKTFLVRMCLEN